MKKTLALTLLIIALLMLTVSPASAQAIITLTGAPLSVSTQSITFPATMHTGQVQTVSGATASAWVVRDPTGTGAGYRVNIRATNFVNGSHSIPVGNFRLALANADIVTVDGNSKPTSALTSLTPLSTSDQTLLSAATDTGMGTYNVTPGFTLTIPADAYAGTYNATVTATIVAGP